MLAFGLVLLACLALVVLTTMLRRDTQRVVALNGGLRAVDTVRIDLTSLIHQSALEFVTQDLKYEESRRRIEGELLEHSAEARARVTDPTQRRLLEKADEQVRAYLALSQGIDLRAKLSRSLVDASDAPRETLREASRLGFEEISATERRLARWQRVENILGVAIAVLVLVGISLIGFSLQRSVFAPLVALSDGIGRFAAGDTSARVEPIGPVELRRTAESFNDMAAHLEQRKLEMLTFLAGVAHDLRNPLAALRMGVQSLEPERRAVSAERERATLAIIGRQVTRLERMVGDFLDASRIESGHLELQLERRDVRELAAEATELYRAASVRHRLVLSAPDAPVEVNCDATRIAQVLNNLVSNAIKYSPAGGEVRVSVAATGDEARLTVRDSGIGISPADLKHIFEPFRRAGASRETAPGVGLGLAVSQRIVEAHGGRLEVESQLGAGSTFIVRLPLASAAHAQAPTPSLQ